MQDGTFVEIEYVGRIKESGEIFDLTDEKLAKEAKIFNPQAKYGPIAIILGNRQILLGVEAKIKEMKPGEKKSFALAPKEAFGEREARLIKTMPAKEFHKQNVSIKAGQFLRIGNNLEGRVMSVSGGRVRVDFNHPLAGKTLEYELKVNRIVEKPDEQVLAIFGNYSKSGPKAVKIDDAKGTATIEVDAESNLAPQAKKRISDEITKFVTGIKEVSFMESFGKNSAQSNI